MAQQETLLEFMGFQDPNKDLDSEVKFGGSCGLAAGAQSEPSNRPVVSKPEEVEVPTSATVCYAGMKIAVAEYIPDKETATLEEIRAALEADFFEFTADRAHLEYVEEKDIVIAMVRSQKLGVPALGEVFSQRNKRIFVSAEKLREAGLPIAYFAGANGLFEVRQTGVGRFSVKISDEKLGNEEWQEGFEPFLPPIPGQLLVDVIGFFRHFAAQRLEAMAHICWDGAKHYLHVPAQRAGMSNVEPDTPAPDLLVMEIHSHHVMPARPSATDDQANVATGLYAIVGRMDKIFPDVYCRYSVNGKYRPIELERIVTDFAPKPPQAWVSSVVVPAAEEV